MFIPTHKFLPFPSDSSPHPVGGGRRVREQPRGSLLPAGAKPQYCIFVCCCCFVVLSSLNSLAFKNFHFYIICSLYFFHYFVFLYLSAIAFKISFLCLLFCLLPFLYFFLFVFLILLSFVNFTLLSQFVL